ncbi:hypothetical protein AB0I84_45305, partial [Streptomyces spectabilis]
GAPGPRQGYAVPTGTAGDGGSVWDALERARRERLERERKQEEARASTYASWTHEELVQELKVLKWNKEVAEGDARVWKRALIAERERFPALIGRLRSALNGKRTASVDDLNAALREPEEA